MKSLFVCHQSKLDDFPTDFPMELTVLLEKRGLMSSDGWSGGDEGQLGVCSFLHLLSDASFQGSSKRLIWAQTWVF